MEKMQSPDSGPTKLDIAAHHVTTSIQLIAIDAAPYSIQLPVMAADELIEVLAKHRNIPLPYDSAIYIHSEFQAEWRRRKRAAYNFFKHADRDPDGTYAGPDADKLRHLNDLQTVFNIIGLRALGYEIPSQMMQYFLLVGTVHPHLIKWDQLEADNPGLSAARQSVGPIDREMYLATLRKVLKLYY
jgi:hypothetical protein